MFRNLVNMLIVKIKKSEYALDSSINSRDIITIVINKLGDYIRGYVKKLGMAGSKGNTFIGKKTRLMHKSHMSIGDGVQIKDYVEINALSKRGIVLGDNASIGKYTIIRGTGSLLNLGEGMRVGKNFGCGDFCFFGCSGGVVIGDNVIMGQNVRFHSQNHMHDDVNIPIKEQGVVSKGIEVGDDCWIGAATAILDGVKIGNGCIIGANSLVNKDIPDYSVAVGNPAKVIRKRK